ncbi:MAG: hypothetical protein Q8Q81_08195 [Oxalobacteraceae bacterium]|nr:hypothetical protein [Oxalobacteraceae bacterium]
MSKALLIALAIYSFFARKQKRISIIIALVLFIASLAGIANGLTLNQILSGWALFLPIIFGVVSYDKFKNRPTLFYKISVLLLLLCSIGVIWSALYTVPWSGFEYKMGDISVEGSREWAYEGFNRPPGLSRMSIAASTHILILLFLVLPIILKKSRFLSAFVLIVSLISIVLTTSKAFIFAVLIVLLGFSIGARFSIIMLSFFLLCMAYFPISTIFTKYNLGFQDPLIAFITVSFDMRLIDTWPNAIKDLSSTSFFFGRGLGGLGSSQKYFGDPSKLLINGGVVDNFFLYLYGNFGLIGVAILIFMGWVSFNLIRRKDPIQQGLGLSLMALLIAGLTCDFIENIVATIVVGMAFAAAMVGDKIDHKSLHPVNTSLTLKKYSLI